MTKLLIRLPFIYLLFICTSFTGKDESALQLKNNGRPWEEFEPRIYARLQSINDLLSYSDSAIGVANRTSQDYVEFLAATIRKRFYHGYSYYSPKDNWLAWLSGVLIWNHLHAIVIPDDIMKQPMAACSQQAIVLKECFKKLGIDYREVNLEGHFVLEGRVAGQWLFFDPNREPKFVNGRKSLDELISKGELVAAYKERLSKEQVQVIFANPVYKKVNGSIAPNGTLFQKIMWLLSIMVPFLLPLSLIVYFSLEGEVSIQK